MNYPSPRISAEYSFSQETSILAVIVKHRLIFIQIVLKI